MNKRLIESFNPKKNDKYSSFIYRFLKKEKNCVLFLGLPRIVYLKNGRGWFIGWFSGQNSFIGSRILFYDGARVEVYSYIKTNLDDIERALSWEQYAAQGECIINKWAHQWLYSTKNTRKCAHCGKWEQRKIITIKTIERQEKWEVA